MSKLVNLLIEDKLVKVIVQLIMLNVVDVSKWEDREEMILHRYIWECKDLILLYYLTVQHDMIIRSTFLFLKDECLIISMSAKYWAEISRNDLKEVVVEGGRTGNRLQKVPTFCFGRIFQLCLLFRRDTG